jgi:hypothetical protein
MFVSIGAVRLQGLYGVDEGGGTGSGDIAGRSRGRFDTK